MKNRTDVCLSGKEVINIDNAHSNNNDNDSGNENYIDMDKYC